MVKLSDGIEAKSLIGIIIAPAMIFFIIAVEYINNIWIVIFISIIILIVTANLALRIERKYRSINSGKKMEK